jgi:RHS repeat-associated protein
LISLLAASVSAYAASPMSIMGTPNTDGAGQFHYSIPIPVPPGTAGMVPHLSLEYSSASGDGFEGYGWSLAGLPVITRCAQTLTYEGVHGGVNYNANDRFCLDGVKLMLTNSGAGHSYGDDGSTYDTQSASFFLITAHGIAGSGPSWFEVRLKNGSVLELGNTSDSKLLVVGSTTVREWLVDKSTDVHHNYLTVTYHNDATNGQAYPTEIDYSGTTAAGPYNSVTFTYTAPTSRLDVTPLYQGGSRFQYTELLTDITTNNGTSATSLVPVLNYHLGYSGGTSPLVHSILTSLTLCDGTLAHCLAPMIFGWQGASGLPAISHASPSQVPTFTGDFNGDGLLDLGNNSCPGGGAIYLGSNTAGSFSSAGMTASYHWWGGGGHTYQFWSGDACVNNLTPAIGDVDGDGFSDIIATQSDWDSGSAVAFTDVLQNNKSGALNEVNLNTSLKVFSLLGDFDGDGRTDGYFQSATTSNGNAEISNGDGTFAAGSSIANTGNGYSLIAGDFNGDGCTDLLTQGTSSAIKFFCSPLSSSVMAPNFSGSTVVPGDFNGDGNTDLLVIGSTSATLYLSNGEGLPATPLTITGVSSWSGYHVVAGDWNGDGKTDIALISQTGGTHLIYLSTGTDFTSAGSITDTSTAVFVADANNDGADDIWMTGTNKFYYFAYQPELMNSVSNGIGATTTIAYDRLNRNGSFYTKGTSASAADKQFDIDGAYYTVSQMIFSNGSGMGTTTYNVSYTYSGAVGDCTAPPVVAPRSNILTSKLLTFTQIRATDSRHGIKTVTNRHIDVPYVGLTDTIKTNVSSGLTVGSVAYDWGGGTFGQNFPTQVSKVGIHTIQHDLSGTGFPAQNNLYTFDAYNNVSYISFAGAQTATVDYGTPYNNTSPSVWILGQMKQKYVTASLSGHHIERYFDYDLNSDGTVLNAWVEKTNTPLQLETTYGYDGFGNVNSVSQVGAAVPTRTNSINFDAKGEFPASFTNAKSQTTTPAYDIRFGTVASITDPNSVVTTAHYDWLGRIDLVTKPDGTKNAFSYAPCGGACPTGGAYMVTTTPQNASGITNGAVSTMYYDAFDRQIATDKQGFDGSTVRTSVKYDQTSGDLAKTSRPYFLTGGTPQWTVYTRDDLGRPTLITNPDMSQTSFCYDGEATAVTNDKGQTKTIVRNDQGQIAQVTDGQTGAVNPSGCGTITLGVPTITYVYDAFGDPLTITDAMSNTITNTFDDLGRKSTSTDPDMGFWQYTYDQLGELTGQTYNKGQSTVIGYDALQRPVYRTEADLNSKWLWDFMPGGLGKLMNACTPSTPGLSGSCPTANTQEKPSYDSAGRVASDKLVLDGTNYTYTPHYNADGRMDTLTYPSGFIAEYDYNASGYLSQIKDHTSGTAVWTANVADAELHLTQQTSGDGTHTVATVEGYDAPTGNLLSICASYSSGPCDGSVANLSYGWDTIGNLTSRADTYQGYTENYCYDALNRMTNSAMGTSCTNSAPKTIGYGRTGNITEKSDVCATTGCFAYGSGAGPHALTGITGTYNGVVNPTFTYDGNGNMTGGAGRTMTYTSFNMAASIAQGTNSLALAYGASHDRYKMCVPDCTTPTATTDYLYDGATGGMSEKVVAGAGTTWRDYIIAPGVGLVAVRVKSGSTTTWRYIVADHLGSVTSVTDSAGPPPNIERDSYDGWGQRRNANGTDAACGTIVAQLTRGYTSQEMLDGQCLINMNARVFDPGLGRFMGADSVVSDGYDSQSYNRYSYVENDPLNHTDPSGHVSCWDKVPPPGCHWHFDGSGNYVADCWCTGTMFDTPDESLNTQSGDWYSFDSGGTAPGGGGGTYASTGGFLAPNPNAPQGYSYTDSFNIETVVVYAQAIWVPITMNFNENGYSARAYKSVTPAKPAAKDTTCSTGERLGKGILSGIAALDGTAAFGMGFAMDALGSSAVAAGCGQPTAPATCGLSLFAGGIIFSASGAPYVASYEVYTTEMIPDFKEAYYGVCSQ